MRNTCPVIEQIFRIASLILKKTLIRNPERKFQIYKCNWIFSILNCKAKYSCFVHRNISKLTIRSKNNYIKINNIYLFFSYSDR
jgi:hypothetical protein